MADLSEQDKALLAGLVRDVRPVAVKKNIISEDERPEYIHLVVDGWAARYELLANGARQITALLIPGDFCDLHATLLERMDHGIVALTDCQVAYVPTAKIDEILLGHPNLAKTLFWSTLVDEAVLRSWVVNVGRRDAFQRIGHLLCEMHLRLKKIGLVSDDKYDLPMTQEELADAIALTPVHVNRTLQRLRKEELIELRGGALTVLDVEKLERLSGFNPAYLHTARRVAANFNDAVAPGSVGRSMRKA